MQREAVMYINGLVEVSSIEDAAVCKCVDEWVVQGSVDSVRKEADILWVYMFPQNVILPCSKLFTATPC